MSRLHPQILAYLELLVASCRALYGDNFLSLVLYGSVVRGTFRPTSDIDLLVLLRRSTLSWGKRISEFLHAVLAHPDVRVAAARLRELNLPSRVEPLILTEPELATHPPILLDLTEEAMILEDRAGVFTEEIARVRTRLEELGARRVWLSGDRWYWVLTPEIRPGEIITI
jgi:predicted nucleotidyltransferase